MAEEKRGRGRPKTFGNKKELIRLYAEFCDHIRENGFYTIPSQSAFCRYMRENYGGADRHTVYTSLNKYFPNIKKEFEELRSDTIAEGAMLGRYNSTMSIFALKHWCKWSDRAEDNGQAECEDLEPLARMLK